MAPFTRKKILHPARSHLAIILPGNEEEGYELKICEVCKIVSIKSLFKFIMCIIVFVRLIRQCVNTPTALTRAGWII